jgi:hypothetical protein
VTIDKKILARTTDANGRPLPKDVLDRRRIAAEIIREHEGAILNKHVITLVVKKKKKGLNKNDVNSIRAALGYKPLGRGGGDLRGQPLPAPAKRMQVEGGPVDGALAQALAKLTEKFGIEELHYRVAGEVAHLRVVQKLTRDMEVKLS